MLKVARLLVTFFKWSIKFSNPIRAIRNYCCQAEKEVMIKKTIKVIKIICVNRSSRLKSWLNVHRWGSNDKYFPFFPHLTPQRLLKNILRHFDKWALINCCGFSPVIAEECFKVWSVREAAFNEHHFARGWWWWKWREWFNKCTLWANVARESQYSSVNGS